MNNMHTSIFQTPTEKGSSEWSAFNVVRDDKHSAFPTKTPTRPLVVKMRGHILWIIQPSASPRLRQAL